MLSIPISSGPSPDLLVLVLRPPCQHDVQIRKPARHNLRLNFEPPSTSIVCRTSPDPGCKHCYVVLEPRGTRAAIGDDPSAAVPDFDDDPVLNADFKRSTPASTSLVASSRVARNDLDLDVDLELDLSSNLPPPPTMPTRPADDITKPGIAPSSTISVIDLITSTGSLTSLCSEAPTDMKTGVHHLDDYGFDWVFDCRLGVPGRGSLVRSTRQGRRRRLTARMEIKQDLQP
ncbi:hypothetical protein N7532_001593 [Penicillium argentinense]|uniref:Uncharacterized protein n=1 Tax=Penicillium argentinense TaxID=1131581 RepID=A0A9W9KML1_9EURO|nr:uncharacterized protein N7532_001593 [Penicillium argentinense]KAJ5111058.1 hypothetical protein N7532_001593 [Penicillium argentinense]